MTSDFHHSFITVNQLRYHLVTCGEGPLVLFTHGFPESWYSWRNQLPALAEAGYRAVAVDMPGYGKTDKPEDPSRYNQIAISDDMAAIADSLGYDTFVSVGHDWGAPTAWNTALRFPDRVRAVVGMSIPYGGRSLTPPTQGFKRLFSDCFFYMLYFQTPGVAEAELESDIPRFLRSFWWSSSVEGKGGFDTTSVGADKALFDAMPDPGQLPAFISEEEADYYRSEFTQNGLRGPLNYYRNLDRNWELSESYKDATVTQPSLFLYGDCDPIPHVGGEFKRMKESLPKLTTKLIENCGHWTQQEQPETVNRHLIEFLQQLPK
ncbi:MAG: epoxide hydrolase [Cellvibrionaceae bacterium]|nr:epoxide hydrolase [Cellvibrionaceae bacterium]|tara:strand:+ start:19796 stop:20755 length:960 start_codon:yes stop_codon:yes gene_type:complete